MSKEKIKPINSKLRPFDTEFWEDEYILQLDINAKLLFLYFLTNSKTNFAGIYKIALQKVAFETKIELEEVENILAKFQDDNKIIYKDGFLWIKNYIKYQSLTPNIVKNIKKMLNQLPRNILKEFIDNVSEDIKDALVNIDKSFFNDISQKFENSETLNKNDNSLNYYKGYYKSNNKSFLRVADGE